MTEDKDNHGNKDIPPIPDGKIQPMQKKEKPIGTLINPSSTKIVTEDINNQVNHKDE